MTQEKEAQGAVNPEVETPPTEPTQEPQAPTKEEVEQLHSDLQKMEQNLKSAQGVTRKQAQDLEELRTQYDTAASSRDTYQALIGLMSQQTGRSEEDIEGEVQAKKPDLIKQAQAIVSKQEQFRQQKYFADKVNSYQAIVEKELELKDGDEDYDTILGLVLAGKWDKADKKIETLKSQKAEPPKEPVETEEKRIERKAREMLDKEGLTKQETGAPSASGGKLTAEAVSKMSPQERWERRDEIDKMPLA